MCLSKSTLSLLALAVSGSASAQLHVWLEPSVQTALIGDTVDVEVRANSGGTAPLVLSDAYLAITWNTSVLDNATPATRLEPAPWTNSYWAPGVPENTDVEDGDAIRELLGQLPPNQPVAPIGAMGDTANSILVTTFQFTLLSDSAPGVVRLESQGFTYPTTFYKGGAIGVHPLEFSEGTYAQATINAVPEPGTLLILGLGALAARKRKRA